MNARTGRALRQQMADDARYADKRNGCVCGHYEHREGSPELLQLTLGADGAVTGIGSKPNPDYKPGQFRCDHCPCIRTVDV